MADTTYLKKVVEPFIRERLGIEYGVSFEPRILRLIPGGTHEFDAVSENFQIVCAIKTAGGKTARGKNPSGKIKDCLAELYYLCLIDAEKRLLILTSSKFYQLLENYLTGRLAPGITLKLIELPIEMQSNVDNIQRKASEEVSVKLSR